MCTSRRRITKGAMGGSMWCGGCQCWQILSMLKKIFTTLIISLNHSLRMRNIVQFWAKSLFQSTVQAIYLLFATRQLQFFLDGIHSDAYRIQRFSTRVNTLPAPVQHLHERHRSLRSKTHQTAPIRRRHRHLVDKRRRHLYPERDPGGNSNTRLKIQWFWTIYISPK